MKNQEKYFSAEGEVSGKASEWGKGLIELEKLKGCKMGVERLVEDKLSRAL